jgi:hypothetical protein
MNKRDKARCVRAISGHIPIPILFKGTIMKRRTILQLAVPAEID